MDDVDSDTNSFSISSSTTTPTPTFDERRRLSRSDADALMKHVDECALIMKLKLTEHVRNEFERLIKSFNVCSLPPPFHTLYVILSASRIGVPYPITPEDHVSP